MNTLSKIVENHDTIFDSVFIYFYQFLLHFVHFSLQYFFLHMFWFIILIHCFLFHFRIHPLFFFYFSGKYMYTVHRQIQGGLHIFFIIEFKCLYLFFAPQCKPM